MTWANGCPSLSELRRLAANQVSAEELHHIQDHLNQCSGCAQAVQLHGPDLDRAVAFQQTAAKLQTTSSDDDSGSWIIEVPQPSLVEESEEQLSLVSCDQTLPNAGLRAMDRSSSGLVQTFLAPPQQADELGRLGPYRILKKLGSGGMGVVFLAEDIILRRSVALKVIKPSPVSFDEAKQRFLREARAAAALDHEHVVTIYQVGEDRGVPFLAMQLLQGETLADRLKRESQLAVLEAVRIARETAEGLAAAHQRGLIHRDIKPSNIWLEEARGKVRIVDFGLARSLTEEQQLTHRGMVIGTPAYMSPEQARGLELDCRSDLFSLGCVIYRMLAGRVPFQAPDSTGILMLLSSAPPPPLRSLNSNVPPMLADLVERLMSKQPQGRPPTAAAVVEALQTIERQITRPVSSGIRPACRFTKAPSAQRPAVYFLQILVLAVLGFGGYSLGPSLFRLVSNQGLLIVEAGDPNLRIQVKQGERTVATLVPGQQIDLDVGEYDLKLVGAGHGAKLSKDRFTLQRGDSVQVQVAASGGH